jgi:hypothetical protein
VLWWLNAATAVIVAGIFIWSFPRTMGSIVALLVAWAVAGPYVLPWLNRRPDGTTPDWLE